MFYLDRIEEITDAMPMNTYVRWKTR